MKFIRVLIAAAALLAASSGAALAQCGTNAPANKFCGGGASSGLSTWLTIPAAALTPIAGGTVLGNPTGASAVPVATTAPVLGIPGTSTGQVGLTGSTSGTAILKAQAAAGSAISLLPTVAGTLVGSATAPLAVDAVTGAVSITGAAGGVLAGAGATFTPTPVLGVPGASQGTLGFAGLTSGTVTVTAQATAGTVTLTLPNASGTVAANATTPLVLSATTGTLTCPTCVTSSGGGAISGTAPISVSAGGVVSIDAPYTTLTASNGGIVYSGATNLAILSATATARQMLQSGASTTPAWSTTTWPATTTINRILYSSAASVIGEISTVNGGLLNASSSGVPAMTITPVLGVPTSSTGTLGFAGITSGTATITPQSVAGTPTLTLPNASGTFAVGASSPLVLSATTGNLTCPTCVTSSGGTISGTAPVAVSGAGVISITGLAGGVLAGSSPAFTTTPTLGASGTLGTIAFGNATSGTITLSPVAGALGSVTLSLPAATDTLVGKATTDTLTNKTIDTAGSNTLKVNGNTLSASAGTATITFPNITDTVTVLGSPQTFTGAKTFSSGTSIFAGSGSGSTSLNASAAASGTLTLPAATDTLVGKATTDVFTNKTMSATSNVLGGVTMTLGSDATGDIYYRNSSGFLTRLAIGSSTNVLTVSGGLPAWAAPGSGGTVTAITPGAGLVSSVTASCSQSDITTTGTLSKAECINAQSGTSYAIADGDRGKLITGVNASAQGYTIAQAGTASAFANGWYTDIKNNSTAVAGIISITATTSTINGSSSPYKIQPGQSIRLTSDGTNYRVVHAGNAAQLPGTTAQDDANAGNLGEYITSTQSSANKHALTTATYKNVLTASSTGGASSITLTPGDWDVSGTVWFSSAASTSITGLVVTVSQNTGALSSAYDGTSLLYFGAFVPGSVDLATNSGVTRMSVSTNTSVYLVARANFTVDTLNVYGIIRARRVR